MELQILSPTEIWKDYDASEGDFDVKVLGSDSIGDIKVTDYGFLAPALNAQVAVALRCFTPALSGGNTVMIVEEYGRVPEEGFLISLAQSGYTVLVPDIGGMGNPATIYPEALAYGQFSASGTHSYKLESSAKESCQYLYSVIIKRSLAFVGEFLHLETPILLGLGDAVEVAMQVAGSGVTLKGLACINGSGYREYIKQNKYGSGVTPELTEERMVWLSGVAAVAYVKNIDCPTFITFGTNSRHADPDRLENLQALMAPGKLSVCLSSETDEYISKACFTSFRVWLDAVSGNKAVLPSMPGSRLEVGDNGVPILRITSDTSMNIEKVRAYFSYGSLNHLVRRWQKATAVTIGGGGYICSPESYDAGGPLFAFAEVTYEGGLVLTSIPEYMDLSGTNAKPEEEASGKILFDPTEDDAKNWFTDEYNGIALLSGGKTVVKTPLGLPGVTTDTDGLKTYNLGKPKELANTGLLQIDLYSEEECEARLILEVEGDGEVSTYSATEELKATRGFFHSVKFGVNDFKKCEKDHNIPLGEWGGVKSLTICGHGIVVGNILFI